MCDNSLATPCGKLAANYWVLLSPQALNERFNKESVDFMQKLFTETIPNENQI